MPKSFNISQTSHTKTKKVLKYNYNTVILSRTRLFSGGICLFTFSLIVGRRLPGFCYLEQSLLCSTCPDGVRSARSTLLTWALQPPRQTPGKKAECFTKCQTWLSICRTTYLNYMSGLCVYETEGMADCAQTGPVIILSLYSCGLRLTDWGQHLLGFNVMRNLHERKAV